MSRIPDGGSANTAGFHDSWGGGLVGGSTCIGFNVKSLYLLSVKYDVLVHI